MDAADQQLMSSGVPIGIRVDTDESMHLIEISPGVVKDSFGGAKVESLTGRRIGVVFWFAGDTHVEVNRTATLNLFATAGLPARTLPLLRGPVLISGSDSSGQPCGLSDAQITAVGAGVGWRALRRLQWRVWRDGRARSARSSHR